MSTEQAKAIEVLCESLEKHVERLENQIEKIDIEEFFDVELNYAKNPMFLYVNCMVQCQVKDSKEFMELFARSDVDDDRLRKAQTKLEEICKKADERLAKLYEGRAQTDFDEVEVWFDIFLRYCKLGQYIRGRKAKYTLLVTTRFYGCYFCDQHVMDIYAKKTEFEVIFGSGTIYCTISWNWIKRGSIAAWKEKNDLDLSAFSDERKQFVTKFGFKRDAFGHNKWDFFMMVGDLVQSGAQLYEIDLNRDPLVDVSQLGGDMLVSNATCTVVYDHRSASLTDRPSAEELLRRVDEVEKARLEGRLEECVVEGKKSKMCHLLYFQTCVLQRMDDLNNRNITARKSCSLYFAEQTM